MIRVVNDQSIKYNDTKGFVVVYFRYGSVIGLARLG